MYDPGRCAVGEITASVDAAGVHDVYLIVMAIAGRTGSSRELIGSVAERLVRTSPAPDATVNVHGD